MYNLSVVITQSGQPNVKTNTSLQVYYYSCADLSLTSVEPNEVLLDELAQYVTLVGSGFFDWEETVCYYGSQETSDVVYVNASHMRCKVGENKLLDLSVSRSSRSVQENIRCPIGPEGGGGWRYIQPVDRSVCQSFITSVSQKAVLKN